MMASAEEHPIQKAVDKLKGKHQKKLEPMESRGARAVFDKNLVSLDSSRKKLDRLDFAPDPENAEKVRPTLEEWAKGNKFDVLMSKHLPVHLGLPVRTYPPVCRLFQVLLLGENLPFLLLTLYDKESVNTKPEQQSVEDFTTRCARMLTYALKDFCCRDFILLPCTLEWDSFSAAELQKEVKVWFGHVADFYSGPSKLRAETSEMLNQALSIVAAASEVTFVLNDCQDAGKNLLVVDTDMDLVLRRFISQLRPGNGQGCQPLTLWYGEETHWTLAMLLEAALRHSYRQKVVIITDNEAVQKCVEKLAASAKRQYGLDSSYFRCVPASESGNSKPSQAKPADVCYVAIDAPKVSDFPGLHLKLLKIGSLKERDKRKSRLTFEKKSCNRKIAMENTLTEGGKRFITGVSSPITRSRKRKHVDMETSQLRLSKRGPSSVSQTSSSMVVRHVCQT